MSYYHSGNKNVSLQLESSWTVTSRIFFYRKRNESWYEKRNCCT